MEKEELQAMKSCFEELYMLISMRGDISSSEVRSEEAEFSSRGVLRLKKSHFQCEFMLISICDRLFPCVFVSF